jgi:hypothetical protein
MDMNKSVVMRIAVAVAVAGMVLTAAAQQGRGPSTAEERARFVEITHKLEKNPLDAGLNDDRDWALRWLIEVPDVHAELCTNVLGTFLKEKKYPYGGEIVRQLTFSGAAFTIENPDKAADRLAQFEAGVEGALKAYSAIVQQKPEAKSKSLEELLQKQSEGKLQDFVREAADKGCRKQ